MTLAMLLHEIMCAGAGSSTSSRNEPEASVEIVLRTRHS